MKKYKKKDILETVDLLIEGNNFIALNYKKNNEIESIVDILTQCQEMAILLGNCLETLEDIGEKSIPLLEDYCENIYQISQNLLDEYICRKIIKKTTRQLTDLKNNIIYGIQEDKIEMVFLPYKASMWDSLESVWKAANEDSECDVYVVPIPYYEKNEQGELAIMHYEGNQFPKDVPIVHYMDYNLAERRPDVAFIHNPYDQYNHVTSIHPAYYVPELKKYVGRVAYIPYFISPEPNPDSLEVQAQKKGFVLQPGVTDTDLVFVQSEDMKQLYVNILEKEIPNVNRKHWEDKIWGLGSPKLDRLHSTKRNDDLLSSEWRSLIYDSKGNRKKVIFYNTSLHDLLNQKNMMEKIADTLAFFKERRDCVLWWRPHPLYESTLASMIPGLLSVYKKIVEDYKTERWGIFDAGEDLDWAMAETDAYYGDGSSVAELYEEAGKPVLYQDTRVKNFAEEDIEIPIWPCTFCVDGDDIWFVHGKINVLIKYNMKEKYSHIVSILPNTKIFQDMPYAAIYKWNKKIYLIPSWPEDILVYDILNGAFTRIAINNIEKYKGQAIFERAYVEGKFLYCIPCAYKAVVKINMETMEMVYICTEKSMHIVDVTRKGNEILAVDGYTNKITIINLKIAEISTKKVGDFKRKYSSIASIDGKIYLFDKNTHSLIEASKSNFSEIKSEERPYALVRLATVLPDYLLINPTPESMELQIINGRKDIVYKTIYEKIMPVGSLYSVYCNGIDEICDGRGNISFYFSKVTNCMYKFRDGKPEEIFNMKMDNKDIDYLKKTISKKSFLKTRENDVYRLAEWMEVIEQVVERKKVNKNCGRRIVKFLKDVEGK